MSSLWWSYESSSGDTICVSVRADGTVSINEYQKFLTQFTNHYSNRITNIRETSILVDNELCTIIHMNGRQQINFPNERR